MFNEEVIVENEYKLLRIFKKGIFLGGARVNRVVVFNNLYKMRILAHLNGHKIMDTGIVEKIENYCYEIQECD